MTIRVYIHIYVFSVIFLKWMLVVHIRVHISCLASVLWGLRLCLYNWMVKCGFAGRCTLFRFEIQLLSQFGMKLYLTLCSYYDEIIQNILLPIKWHDLPRISWIELRFYGLLLHWNCLQYSRNIIVNSS